MPAKHKVAVLGATGYSGLELTRLLLRHSRVEKPVLLRRSESQNPHPPQRTGKGGAPDRDDFQINLADIFPALSGNGNYPLEPFSWPSLKQQGVGLLFLATPHEVSRALVPDATVVANPGCYATTVILALAPILKAGLVDRERGIIADSKSGVSGAGKEPTSRTHFVSVADNFSAYGVFTHRHLGEMAEQLRLTTDELTFTPHLLPIPRGILSTIYVHLKRPMQAKEVEACYRDFYKGRRFVRVFGTPKLPEIQFSLNTNYCDLGFCLAPDGQRLVIVSCEDNLIKGAAGQAVQNMNLMYGWPEEEGLL